jgi:hypothetical protein
MVAVPVAIAAVALALASGVPARGPVAHAAGKCRIGNSRSYGYSYLTFLWQYRTTCGVAHYVAKHHGHVRGWHCSRKILDKSPVQYDATVTCHGGRREVQWSFTQNT